MKKILCALLMTSVSSVAIAETRNHPYVGLTLGGMNSYHSADATIAAGNKNTFNMSKQSFAGGVLTGWMFHLANGWRLGVEADYLLTSNEPDVALNKIGGTADRARVKSSWALGGALRLGYKVSKSTMLYVRAGMEYRKFKTQLTPKAAAAINNDTSKTAFTPGVGFEVNLTPQWVLGGEFRTAFYGSYTNRSSGISEITVKPRVDAYLLNLKYRFGHCHGK